MGERYFRKGQVPEMQKNDSVKQSGKAPVRPDPAAGKQEDRPQAAPVVPTGRPEGEKAPAAETEKQAAQTAGELAQAQKKLKEAEEQLAKQKDILLRTAAEYDNYRKRTSREKQSAYQDATADAVKEFLPVADNLERALEQKECSVEDLRKGVEMVEKQMQDALKKLGVTTMGKEGEAFDPTLHSAVAHVEDEKAGENTVAKVFQKGYKIGDRVVRHAMVQVAN